LSFLVWPCPRQLLTVLVKLFTFNEEENWLFPILIKGVVSYKKGGVDMHEYCMEKLYN